jgi:geranylgeranyl diphosphate synthase type I
LAPAFADFTTMREHVIAGQLLDISAHEGPIDEARARAIAILKSGSYSIENPLLIGARLGNADDATRAALAAFGRPLGEAFQLRDDLLGVFGDPTLTGKAADSDIREGKRNVLFAKTLSALTGDERIWFESNWGRAGLDVATVERLRDLLDSSGARAATEELVDELGDTAAGALAEAEIDAAARAALTELMDIAIRRTS